MKRDEGRKPCGCGRRCVDCCCSCHFTRSRAVRGAAKLCAALGSGWAPVVWDVDDAWQHAAVNGRFRVTHPLPGMYMASYSEGWLLGRGRTANGALRKCVSAMVDALADANEEEDDG